ncbi:HAMP domain-containing histidine kinase [Reichenbachiella agarivorans]|uniref:histidine kinase n=1 Tax=Reichenbachiella agarivorans TaxID=2979464 RepID=A0ABY6CXY6_9BACT|nr:HAMP domain-containing sensor histidine kinase [Reichenbachiella agarivorans]UXP33075.1 HAMP domain-containing histidine kinase [Reichenbachiella agarivorans]
MNRRAYRILVILAVISIGGTLTIQLFWMKKAFDVRSQQFDHNVKSALLNITEILCSINLEATRPDAIEQISSNYFIVKINNKITPLTLETLLTREFKSRGIKEVFEYGIFDCSNGEMVYGQRVNPSMTAIEGENTLHAFPNLSKDEYYFGIYFPSKTLDLVGQMGIWISSSAVLLIVVLFFGFSLFMIFRQRRLSEIQKDFVNNMTHEFKTPIATMRIAADVLRSPEITDDPKRLSTYTEIINKEIDRLQGQVERVLQMSSIKQEQIQLNKEWIEIDLIIHDLVQRSALSNPNVSISVDTGMPRLFVDQLHMSNVFDNLIDNAIKYSDKEPMVEISWSQHGRKRIEINFKDHGKGIDPKHQSLIFDKFYRVPTGNRHDVKGFGLGLYYVKMVVAAHGGKINVVSQLNEGTTISIILPME